MVTVEDLLLIIGQKLGFENIGSASRMNKVVVLFFKSELLVNELTEQNMGERNVCSSNPAIRSSN